MAFEGNAALKGGKSYEPPIKGSSAGSTPPQSLPPVDSGSSRMLTREARPVATAERADSAARMAWPGGKMQVTDPVETFT